MGLEKMECYEEWIIGMEFCFGGSKDESNEFMLEVVVRRLMELASR